MRGRLSPDTRPLGEAEAAAGFPGSARTPWEACAALLRDASISLHAINGSLLTIRVECHSLPEGLGRRRLPRLWQPLASATHQRDSAMTTSKPKLIGWGYEGEEISDTERQMVTCRMR